MRTYSLSSLQKLLNITLLYDNGYKISKIAKIPEADIPNAVKEVVSNKTNKSKNLNAFKLAMMNFDQTIFFDTYDKLLKTKSFREVFKEVFIPLLNEIGLLWQTDTISPAHEHFITSLIKQKILVNTERIQHQKPIKDNKVFVSFLPENEIHDIGLLYLNYEILLKGYKVIYLGQTIPIESLVDLKKYFDNIYFLSYFTVKPDKSGINDYISDFEKFLEDYANPNLWILGRQTQYLEKPNLPKFLKIFTSIEEVVQNL
ncbi:cobalamin B12-binding domain-containing protein [Maribacter litopenaei]|uniref:cobalamin B12-binding domain-containing protein n=1 Tax=Maribacter litopenaei TaxID=2976127 RepID=UPI003B8478BF